ncbi:oxidoreductase [Burkholderia vietnamiensis]|uniref:oxidoreductase n=1 Tax=Burkholderia vietnamiensis TaxID=60552 RepID=UPI00075CA2ED|nr:oxidoreductase [Burkholderia vietnamiensis]KVE91643.1 short-chain dehydrogenase [Burkholderia vietnamiensis]
MSKNDMRVAIVTGASSGIGRATALALGQAGYRVFGTSRKAYPASADGITMLACDVTDDDSVRNMVTEVVGAAGRIDLLVNNAGIGLFGAAEESSAAQARALFDVNVFGVLRVTNAVLPEMRRQKHGRIINISSVLGLVPSPYSALYASTKHAVEGYSESLDHELRTRGIRVVLVEPAVTRTSFEDNTIRPDRELPVYDSDRARIHALLPAMIAAGDAPEIVAATVLKAATEIAPKRRYTAGKQASQVRFLRRYLPESFVDKAIRKFNRLPA